MLNIQYGYVDQEKHDPPRQKLVWLINDKL